MRTAAKFALAFVSAVAMAFSASASVGPEDGRLADRVLATVTFASEASALEGTLVASAGDRVDGFFVKDFVRPRPFFFQPRPFFFDDDFFFEDDGEEEFFFDREQFFDREAFFDRERDD